MAKIRLNLGNMNIAELIDLAMLIKSKFTGHTKFTAPEPPLLDFGAAITDLTNKNGVYNNAKAAADLALTERDNARVILENYVRAWGAYAESKTSDAAELQSGGFNLRAGRAPINEVAQVTSLTITAGDNDGEVDVQWDSVRGAKSYEIQISSDPNNPSSWSHKLTSAKSKATLRGLTVGARVWVRVRAIGSAVEGPWSDPATKLVA